MPDNSYFDKRMANGDKLSDIFDSLDFRYGCYSEDKARPITVRVGKLYNYVANNYISSIIGLSFATTSMTLINVPTLIGDLI